MASGTISLGSSGALMGQIVWSSSSNGTAANSSQVTASIQAKKSSSTSVATKGTWKYTLNIGGTSKSDTYYGSIGTSWVTLCSFTVPVSHSNNGTGTCYISGQITAPTGTTLAGKSVSGNSTVTLDTIPRQATIVSAPNFNDEANPAITYSNPAGTAVTSLMACISLTGDKDDIAYRDISKSETSYTFSLTDDERAVLRGATTTAKSRTVWFYIKTVINGETYTSRLSKVLSIVNAAPVVSPTVVDSNSTTIALTGDENVMVRYYSNAKITFGASALKSATISSKKVTCGSKSRTTDGTISAVDSGSFVFSVTDSRGNTTKQTITKTLINYIKPTCVIANGMPDAEGNLTIKATGNYFNGSFGSVDNTLAVKYRYKVSGGSYSAWNAMTTTISENTYSATVALSGLDYRNVYCIQTCAIDKLNEIQSEEVSVKATPVFDWSGQDFNFNVPVSFNYVMMTDFVAEQGETDGWTYRKWNSGKSECWRSSSLTISSTTQANSPIYTGAIQNVTFPTDLFITSPIVIGTAHLSTNYNFAIFSVQSVDKNSVSWTPVFTGAITSANQVAYYIMAIGQWK